ncbi:YbaK/EbsC family protein [Streptomyces sp. NBC_00659]|uniref:YbaK/EbsC family protein n=1 Tax=Streptomyces sp. NBC_00659 TaxID=2903669 RepID=UPI002E33D4A6|nr:YbaK/EbsC family protein [Streptomyces sp. NBC_00659]
MNVTDENAGEGQSSVENDTDPRFAEALRELGLGEVIARVRRFPATARTTPEAAAAIGCEPSQICKSLFFAADGAPVLVLLDGSAHVGMELVRRQLGAEKITRAGAHLVRESTGYGTGAVPPFGHRTRIRVLVDRSVLGHDTVWASAGTPFTVFPMDPRSLIAHAGGTLVDVREPMA